MFLNTLFCNGLAMKRSNLFLGLVLFMGISTAHAVALVTQSPLDGGAAWLSDWSGGNQNADNFSLGQTSTLESIQWWGSYDVQGGDDFNVRIFANNGGMPEVNPDYQYLSLGVVRDTTTMFDSSGHGVFSYELVLPTALTLQAGSYYLSILNNNDISTTNNNNPSSWQWLVSDNVSGSTWFRSSDGDNWGEYQDPAGFAFALNGTQPQPPQTVPEPGIFSLLALGALLMSGRRNFNRFEA